MSAFLLHKKYFLRKDFKGEGSRSLFWDKNLLQIRENIENEYGVVKASTCTMKIVPFKVKIF